MASQYSQLADARGLPRKQASDPAPPVDTGVMQCLVASCDKRRREMLYEAATSQGWRAIACQDGTIAAQQSVLQRVQLALIDLQSARAPQQMELKRLAESLAQRSNTLLVLCGSKEDSEEEIWARGLGVWIYLPGVDESSDVGSLCAEARQVAARHLRVDGSVTTKQQGVQR